MDSFLSLSDLVDSAIADESPLSEDYLFGTPIAPVKTESSLLDAAWRATDVADDSNGLLDSLWSSSSRDGDDGESEDVTGRAGQNDADSLVELYEKLTKEGVRFNPEAAPTRIKIEPSWERPAPPMTMTTSFGNSSSVSSNSSKWALSQTSSHRFGALRPEHSALMNRTPKFPQPSTPKISTSFALANQLLVQQNNSSSNNSASQGGKELTKRDVSSLWRNDDVRLQKSSLSGFSALAMTPTTSGPTNPDDDDEEEEEEEGMGQADTFADYMPSKLKLGVKHPDPVVETSSMASVLPPDVWYQLKLPREIIDGGLLSALQLEAIVYASQQHWNILQDGTRAGFLIGDGAGVGKGRTIAGIIYENYLQKRKKAVWFSVSNDLRYDAIRDLRDIGATKIDVHSLNKFKYGKISGKSNNSVKKGVIFSTYSALIGESSTQETKYNTRLKQLLHWCGEDFEGVIIFDECHKAKNLFPVGSAKPTKTAQTVMELQQKLPKARVVYSSATGASEPRNMAYMTRLGLWGKGTQFPDFGNFIQAVEKRGVGAMEMVAMDMKLRGMYIARQLSFSGVTFRIEDIPLDGKFVLVYDEAVRLWVRAREKFQEAMDIIDMDRRVRKTIWGQFWSCHQRFFKYMCIAAKVGAVVELSRKAIRNGKCVVIGLQSTGEARMMEQLEEAGGDLTDFVSTARGTLQTLIEKYFPAPKLQDGGGGGGGFGLAKEPVYLFQVGGSSTAQPNKRKRKRAGDAKKRVVSTPTATATPKTKNSESSASSPDSSDPEAVAQRGSGAAAIGGGDDSDNSSGIEMDDFNPFAVNGDGAAPWLSRNSQPKAKKAKRKGSLQPIGNKDDSLESVLATAGLKSKFGSWSKPASKEPSPQPVVSSTLSSLKATAKNLSVPREPALATIQMKNDLLDRLDVLGPKLPSNTLDELIDQLGGPNSVAEMTGRKGRMVTTVTGSVQYESRSRGDVPLEMLNVFEKERFVNGEKLVAIISEAASSGISLQADRRVKNQRRRVHITLELPWSADRAIQQFGRTHRSNQTSAPEYLFLISELAGERRFASIVAKRLECLGALTHGDRRATETRDLSRYNFDTKYGRTALEAVLKAVLGQMRPLSSPPSDYQGNFFEDVKKALIGVGFLSNEGMQDNKDMSNISRFLNRILGVEVNLQNTLFAYFVETLNTVIAQAKKAKAWDEGILDVGSRGENVVKQKTETFEGSCATGAAMTELHTIGVERGMKWEEALQTLYDNKQTHDGFYTIKQDRGARQTAILVKVIPSPYGINSTRCNIFRANVGRQFKKEKLEDVFKKFRTLGEGLAKTLWEEQFVASLSQCTHAYSRGHCKNVTVGLKCEFGMRRRSYHVLSGSVLSVWTEIESVFASVSQGRRQSKIQVVRLKTTDGSKIVGVLIPEPCCGALRASLQRIELKTKAQALQEQQSSEVGSSYTHSHLLPLALS
ncbi:protein strawberry notch homolog 1-like isoform X2 [Oscarella lobularis]|uniref:protein strawberry notch homolog 1-like isoform X2 n=1 Tax=Oscarella lobularis TaxID=121494 RepID=UPI003313141B